MRIALAGLVVAVLAAPARAGAPVDVRVDPDNSPDGQAIDGKEITATASTTLCEKKPKLCHGPEQMIDGKLDTAWCEGLPNDGEGAVLTFSFAHPQALTGFEIVPHFAHGFALAEANGALRTIGLATDGDRFDDIDFDDLVAVVRKRNPIHEIQDDCGDETCLSRDQRITGGFQERVSFGHYVKKAGDPDDEFVSTPIKTSKVVITLEAAYPGKRYHDTCASEITFYRAK